MPHSGEEPFAQALTLNVDGEPIEVREIESCSLSDTEEFELELPVGGHILSADIVYFELGWTSPEVAIEVIENPEAMTPDADIVGDDEGCGCSTGGPSTAFSLLSLLALPLVRRRRPSAGRHG